VTPGSEAAQDHDHGHDHDHGPSGHGHSHATVDRELVTRREAIRAIWVSVAGLGLTAAIQLAIVAVSDSVSLFADALHNVGDVAGTAALWVGFRLSRRPADQQFTYGWRRAEDLAGLFIVLAILVSAVLAISDAVSALLGGGHEVRNHGIALAAALVGAVGNEAVAIYKTRVGRRIDSVPLVADGEHARVDGLVSLAAAAGIAGAWLGFPLADPLVGLGIGLVILRILFTTGREVLLRVLDATEEGTVTAIREVASEVEGVLAVHDVRARHAGRALLVSLHVDVDPDLSVRGGHDLAEEVRHALAHRFATLEEALVHVDPAGHDGAHEETEHHFG
jgi:cation diffusion facilitator family transporter